MDAGTHNPPRRATVAVTVAALAASFLVTSSVTPSPGAAGAAKPADDVGAPIVWSVCDPPGPPGVVLQCARITVPLDWKDPGGRTITLAVIRLLASNQKERIGTLFINPGGPADTGIGLVQGDPQGLDALGGGHFDVVSWDPRGSNASTRVLCFRDQGEEARYWAGVSFPLTATEQRLQMAADLAKRCGEVSGWLLPHISTADTARDLDHLRVLLGEEKLTYVGLSYGSYLGQTYANLFPDKVRAMLLDSIIDAVEYSKSAETRAANFSSSADEVFDQFLSSCDRAGPAHCALAGGGQTAAERVEPLFAQLKGGAPISAPGTRPPLLSPQTLGYTGLLLSQFEPMRAPRVWPRNAADFAAALQGDGSALASSGGAFFTPAGMATATTSASIQCADAPAAQSPQAAQQVLDHLEQVSRLQGVFHFWWEWAPCAFWPVHGQDNYRGPWNAKTPNPILLINGRFDPNTGYANAVHAEHYLGNAVLLTQEGGYGHVFFQDPSTCVTNAMLDYLVHLITPPPGKVCQSDRQPFDPQFGQPLP
jgi:pimeloyl-ACP methyl ester carboxylesterase